MIKRTDSKGFSAVEIVIVIIVIAVIGGIGWFVWQGQQTKTSNNDSANNSGAASQSGDPYTGWTSATLKYEAANIKYPSTWKISNVTSPNGVGGPVTPGSDQVVLTSPTGLIVKITTGVAGISGGFPAILTSSSISTLGAEYHLNFNKDTKSTTEATSGACVGTTADKNAKFVTSKNIKSTSNSTAYNVVCLQYEAAPGAPAPSKPISTFENDASFKDAKLIIQSLGY